MSPRKRAGNPSSTGDTRTFSQRQNHQSERPVSDFRKHTHKFSRGRPMHVPKVIEVEGATGARVVYKSDGR